MVFLQPGRGRTETILGMTPQDFGEEIDGVGHSQFRV